MVPTGCTKTWRTMAIRHLKKHQKEYSNNERENSRARWRQKWMEEGLAGVGTGMLPDHCREGGVGQVSHQLQPWPSSLLLFLSHTLSASFNHPPPASHPPLVPLLCSYKSISLPTPPHLLPSVSCTFPLPLSLFLSPSLSLLTLATPLSPFIVGSAVGVKRSEVGRQEGEKEAKGNMGVWKWESECI